MKRILRAAAMCVGLSLALAGSASASAFVIYAQGAKGDRQAFYIGTLTRDFTPMDAILGPEAIKQITLIVVYESPQTA